MQNFWIRFILSVLLLKCCKSILIPSNNESTYEFTVELNGSFSKHFSVNSSSPLLKDVHLDNTVYKINENNNVDFDIAEGHVEQQYHVYFNISRVNETSLKRYSVRVSNEENETIGFNILIKKEEHMDICNRKKKSPNLTVNFNQSTTKYKCLASNTPIKSIVASQFYHATNSGESALNKYDITNNTSLVLIRDGAKVGQYNLTFFYKSVTSPINNTYYIYNTANRHLTLQLEVKLQDYLAICSEEKNEKVVFADEGTSLNVSFCVLSTSDLLDYVFLNDKILAMSTTKIGLRIVINKSAEFKDKFDLFLLIEKINNKNRSVEITVINKALLRLHLKVIIKTKGIYFTLEKQGLLYPGDKQALKCELPYSPNEALQVTKRFNNTTLACGNAGTMLTLQPMSCSDIGTYICEQKNRDRNNNFASIDLDLKLCPPVMCEGFSPNLTKTVNIGDNIIVMFCVISPNLASNLLINDVLHTYNDTSDQRYMISNMKNGSRMYHFIYFSIHNVVPKYAKVYSMLLNTTDNKSLNLLLDTKLLPDNLQLCDKETSRKIIFANIGDNLTMETCVHVSLHNVLHRLVVDFNGTTLYQTGCQLSFCILWSPNTIHFSNSTIYIKLLNIADDQFNIYPVYVTTMYNNTDVISVLNYTLDIRLKETCTLDVNVTQRGSDYITLSITLGANLKNQQFIIKAVPVNDSSSVYGDIYFTAEEDGVHNIVRTISGLNYNTEYMINISLSADRKTEFECHPLMMYTNTTADAPYTADSQFILLAIGISLSLVTLFLAVTTLFVFLVKTKRIVLKKKPVSSRPKSRADIVRQEGHADTDYVNLRNESDACHYNNISDSVIDARPVSDKLLNTDYFKNHPGRYSSNGLIYVTIDHSQTRRKPAHHSSFNKADKVAYVQIDCSKSLNLDSSSTYCNIKSSFDKNLKPCKEFSVDKLGPK